MVGDMQAEFHGGFTANKNGYRLKRSGSQLMLLPVEPTVWSVTHDLFDPNVDAAFVWFSQLGDEGNSDEDLLGFCGLHGAPLDGEPPWSVADIRSEAASMAKLWEAYGLSSGKELVAQTDNLKDDLKELERLLADPVSFIADYARRADASSPIARYAIKQISRIELDTRVGATWLVNERHRREESTVQIWVGRLPGGGFSTRESLWAQLADAVLQGHEFMTCEQCSKPMRVRARRVFCSAACRVRNYRHRRSEAKRLFKLGKTVPQIARAISMEDVDLISEWLGL